MSIVTALTGLAPPPPRMLATRTLRDFETGDVLDHAMVVVFVGPASATGDDLVELHVHGGIAVVAALLALLARLGLSPASPGAFTRRAFDNGKVDLGQVEALGDLIAAETDIQRQAALARTGERLADRVTHWRTMLISVRADVEATLDFAEDEGIGIGLNDQNRAALLVLVEEFEAAERDSARSGRLRDGVTIAIVGPVNAGKSTLLNTLARRDVAMVASTPGTTRDVIEARIVLGGVPVTIIDTAGVRVTTDPLEAEGIRRGEHRAAVADIVISLESAAHGAIQVISKSDLHDQHVGWDNDVLHLSGRTGAGVDLLITTLTERITALVRGSEPALIASDWQRRALKEASGAVMAALTATDAVIIADELRNAANASQRLIGRTSSDDILDVVFARFCIGK